MWIPRTRSPEAARRGQASEPHSRAGGQAGGRGETGAYAESTSAVVEEGSGVARPMSKRRPDPVDERILRLLVRNAGLSWRDVGDEVGLSANAVAQRVKRLEADGWILGYTAPLDPRPRGEGA